MELRADREKRCGPEKTAYAMTKEQKELLRKLENGGEDNQPKKKGFFEKLKEDME